MKPRYKSLLPQRLALHGPAFKMTDIMLESFQLQVSWGPWLGCGRGGSCLESKQPSALPTRSPLFLPPQDGLKRCVNIIDVVHAATALLECGSLAGKDDLPSPSAHVDKFWQCYHALSWGSDGGELRRGLDLAKRVQKALIRYE